ncbi:MAG: ABC transporter substrate-binding protein [Spirochaetota bacterium]
MLQNKKFILILILLSFFMIFSIACQNGEDETDGGDASDTQDSKDTGDDKYGGTLIYGKSQSAIALDPGVVDEGGSSTVVSQIYESLLTYNPGTAEIVPHLAKSYEISDGGKTITFKLREDVKFHDGTTMDADAVVFSLERQNNREHPFHKHGPWKYWSSKGWSDRYNDDGSIKSEGLIESIEKVDDYTVQITLSEPDSSILYNFALYFTAIVSPTAAEKYGEDFKKNPVGTGPFKFVQWVKDDTTILERNEDYWGKKAYLERLIFKIYPDNASRVLALEKGEADIIDTPDRDNLERLAAMDRIKIQKKEGLTVGYVAINVEQEPFNDVRVRQAVNHAVNKEEIIKGVYGILGEPGKVPLPPSLWGYNKEKSDYEYNPEKAKELLKEAGYEDGFEFDLFAMKETRPYNPNPSKVAEIMQAQLADVGLKANIVTYEIGTYWDKVDAGEFDLAMTGWSGEGDPDDFLYNLFTKGYLNSSRWYNDEYINLVTKAKTETTIEGRAKLYKDAQEILLEEAPIVMLAYGMLIQPMKESVNGFVIYPSTKLELKSVWIEK